MKTVYFAHPISDYGTPWEVAAETAIGLALPGFDIVNPNRPDFDDSYRAKGMQFFMDRAAECDALVATPFPDGSFGAGVGKEAFAVMMARRPIYLLDRAALTVALGVVEPVLNVAQTRLWIERYRSIPKPG